MFTAWQSTDTYIHTRFSTSVGLAHARPNYSTGYQNHSALSRKFRNRALQFPMGKVTGVLQLKQAQIRGLCGHFEGEVPYSKMPKVHQSSGGCNKSY